VNSSIAVVAGTAVVKMARLKSLTLDAPPLQSATTLMLLERAVYDDFHITRPALRTSIARCWPPVEGSAGQIVRRGMGKVVKKKEEKC